MNGTLLLAALIQAAALPADSDSASQVSPSPLAVDTVSGSPLPEISLHEIEVSAGRALRTTPVAATTVSRSEIDRRDNGRDIPYLLSMTPSLVMTSDAGAGIGYSGIRVRGSDPTRINVMTNGVPVNDPESHSVYWVNMPDFASSVRDVQVQRGAGTSTNGAGAFGASVNMVTDTPSTRPYGRVTLGYGMYATHRETVEAGTGLIGGHWTLEARVSNIGSNGYIDRASSDLWSYFGQIGFSAGRTDIRLLAFGGREVTYMAWDYASREEMEKYGRRYNPCGLYYDTEGRPAFYPDQKDHFDQHHLQLLLRQRISGSWSLNAALYYTKGDGYYEQYKRDRSLVEYGLQPYLLADGTLADKSDLVRLKFNDNDFGGFNINATYRRGRVDAVGGVSASWFDGAHFGRVLSVRNYLGPINPLEEYYRNTGRKFDANAFLRANVELDARWSLFGDLQYRAIHYSIRGVSDNFDWSTGGMAPLSVTRDWGFFNPKAGVNFESGHHRAFASWSVAHREPTRSNFTDGDRNHDPRPERLFDYEAGYTFSLPWLTVGANLYFMDYKDQLVLTGQLSDVGAPLTVNAPESYRAGIELQGALRPVDWFEWHVNATFSRNRIKNFTEYIYEGEWHNPITRHIGSTPISFSPDVLFNNSFDFKFRGFDASLTSHYVGGQYLTNAHSADQMLKAYFVSDLSLGYDFGALAGVKGLRVALSVNNLFNARYESNGYAGAGYYVDDKGEKVIYRYAGYAAQATTNVMATLTLKL